MDENLQTAARQNAPSFLQLQKPAEGEIPAAKEPHKTEELNFTLAVLRAILDATSDGVLASDDLGRITHCNARWCEIWSVSRENVLGRSGQELWDSIRAQVVNPDGFVQAASEAVTSGGRHSDRIDLNDGRILEWHSELLSIEQNRARVWTFRDVTERRRADLNSRYLAAIVSSSDDAIVSKNLQSIITSWNSGAKLIFGYGEEEMIGQSILKIIPRERQHEEETILSRIRQGLRVDHYETVRVAKDGREIYVSLTVSPIRDDSGKIVGVSKIARDITQRKAVEEELRQAKLASEKADQERSHLLESERVARAEAEKASRMKDEFLATLSHELRTPLNAVLGWANLLRGGDIEPDEVDHGLEVIQRNAQGQAQIINDLLDMSRIVSGKVRLDVQRVDLAAIVNEAVESVLVAAQAKGVEIQRIIDSHAGTVSGDPSRLQQVFWNLLTNATKFTPRDGRVRVTLERIDSHVEVRVEDNGEGIAEEFLPHLFDRFQQADASTTRRHGGLGLGLAIVKQLVELHGGRVRATSGGLGKGSEFTVRLPLRSVEYRTGETNVESPRESLEAKPLPEITLKDVRILVVDDEPDARELVKRLLETADASVHMAASAQQAMQEITSFKPHVLICDIGMPNEDGYSLIQRVRTLDNECRGIPAIALTAYARSEDRIKAIRSGFQMHLTKPVEPAELLAVVQSLCS